MTDRIMCAGPVVKNEGKLPRRVVLRVFFYPDQRVHNFVVHDQYWLDGKSSFGNGDYYPVEDGTHGWSRTEVMRKFELALLKWQDRVMKLGLDQDHESLFDRLAGWYAGQESSVQMDTYFPVAGYPPRPQ